MSSSQDSQGMSLIVETVCGWVKGFILIYGIHVILYGHLTPGGGFVGGVIAAAAFVLVMLAEGEQAVLKVFSRRSASTFDSLGMLLFWLMGMLGVVMAGTFFVNLGTTADSSQLTLFSGGIIPFCNIGIGLKVCSSIYVVALVLMAHRVRADSGDRNEGEK